MLEKHSGYWTTTGFHQTNAERTRGFTGQRVGSISAMRRELAGSLDNEWVSSEQCGENSQVHWTTSGFHQRNAERTRRFTGQNDDLFDTNLTQWKRRNLQKVNINNLPDRIYHIRTYLEFHWATYETERVVGQVISPLSQAGQLDSDRLKDGDSSEVRR